MTELSLQERHAPESRCFGCGPANPHGLHVRSRPADDAGRSGALVADWEAEPAFEAFDGFVSGGILATLLDCHSNWTAAVELMRGRGQDRPPGCVTGELAVRFLQPTPSDRPLHLLARPVETREDRVVVEAEVRSDDVVTATARGTFIAVRPDHPAYERW